MTAPTRQEAPVSRDSRYLESILHHDIPLTREMGLKVLDCTRRWNSLPGKPINHRAHVRRSCMRASWRLGWAALDCATRG